MKTPILQTFLILTLCGAVYAEPALQDREAQLTAMFREHNTLLNEQRFDEALHLARRVMEIAPDEPAVHVLLTVSLLAYNVHRSIGESDRTIEDLAVVAQAFDVPIFSPSPVFSPNWEELVERRRIHVSDRALESERRILRQLDQPVTVNIDQPLSLEEALLMICAQVDLMPFIDRTALREAGIQTDTMVTLPRANGIRARSVLNVILAQVDLTYTVRNEMLNITTKSAELAVRGVKFHRLYYVGDLIGRIPVTPDASPASGIGAMSLDDIQTIIQTVIEPDSWKDGRAFLTFHPATRSLAIRQTEEVHVQIEDLLGQIRRLNDGEEPQPPPTPHLAAQPQRPQSEERILRQLEMPVTFHPAPQHIGPLTLEQAVNMICAQVDLVPFIDKFALQEIGVQTNTMVTMPSANEIKMRDILNTVLDQHGLAYVVKHEMLIITSKRAARGPKLHRLYYVGDIVDSFGDLADSFDRETRHANLTPEIREMLDIITKIDPDSWWEGDAFLTFHPATQSLAIRHFEDVHVQIEELLGTLRAMNDERQTASVPQWEEQISQRPLTLRERMRARTLASPNRILR